MLRGKKIRKAFSYSANFASLREIFLEKIKKPTRMDWLW